MPFQKSFILLAVFIASSAFAATLPKSSFFVENVGQWEGAFAFRYEGGGAMWYITPEGMTIDFRQYEEPLPKRGMEERLFGREETEARKVRGHVVKVDYVNANPQYKIVGEDKLSHYSNYFYGADSCQWRTRVGHYQRVIAKNVWPGVDIEYRIAPEGIESVYHVAAGVDPAVICIRYEGLDAPLTTDAQGNLVLKTSLGDVREKAPIAWQVWQSQREEVGISFQVSGNSEYRLWCPGHDRNLPTTIDPLLYGSYFGGRYEDYFRDITVALDGNIVVGGYTYSDDFPVTPGAYQSQRLSNGGFISKLTPRGDSLMMSSYIGGIVQAVGAGAEGSVWGTGYGGYHPELWPLTADAFDTTYSGGSEGFLVRLSADGTTLLFSSYLGGIYTDFPYDLQIDTTGLVYIVGDASSPDFPVTANALFPNHDPLYSDGFLTIYDPQAGQLAYSSFIGGNNMDQCSGMWLLSPGRLWVWGSTRSRNFPVTTNAFQPVNRTDSTDRYSYEGFFLLWDTNDNEIEYGSYIGGGGSDAMGAFFVWDSTRVILCGLTKSFDFPFTQGAFDSVLLEQQPLKCQDGFVTVLQLPNTLLHSTLLGGDDHRDYVFGVYGDEHGIRVAGETYSYDFPVTPDGLDTVFNNNGLPTESSYCDAYAVRLDTALTRMEYGTFLGGGHVEYVHDVQFLSADTVWIVGETGSVDFPWTPGAFDSSYAGVGDGFLLKFAYPESSSAVHPHVGALPSSPSLSVYPNPFNSATVIRYLLPRQAHVDLEVFDILGRVVKRLDLGNVSAGSYSRNLDFSPHASGTYIVRLKTPDQAVMTKIVLVK